MEHETPLGGNPLLQQRSDLGFTDRASAQPQIFLLRTRTMQLRCIMEISETIIGVVI